MPILLVLVIAGCAQKNVNLPHSAIDPTASWLAKTSQFGQVFTSIDTVTLKRQPNHLIGQILEVRLMQDNSIIVADNITRQLLLYDGNGHLMRQIGRSGSGPGEYMRLADIGLDGLDNIMLFDNGLRRVTLYDSTGVLIKSYKVPFGYHLLPSSGGAFFILNTIAPIGTDGVDLFGKDGNLENTFFEIPKAAVVDQIPIGAGSIVSDSMGNVYIVHGCSYKVSKFTKNGKFLGDFGRRPSFFKALSGPIRPPDNSSINEFTPAIKLLVLSGHILSVIFSRNVPKTCWMELYDLNGNYLTEVTLPSGVGTPAAVSGKYLYLYLTLQPKLKDAQTGLPNPMLVTYKLNR